MLSSYLKLQFSSKLVTSCLLNTIIRTTTGVSATQQDNQKSNESQRAMILSFDKFCGNIGFAYDSCVLQKPSQFIYVMNNSGEKLFFEKIPVLPFRDGLVNNDNFFDNSAIS
ncbi:unnamed protein product [Rotaria magnacalcarata]|uniref:Uncharacterized protein n=1 Tax=Rotaria magnacalcarata TaxID=392030 RepID=A0A816LQL9_9BILA|nr:unnamed protein product [Rotaria magnacalcarata]